MSSGRFLPAFLVSLALSVGAAASAGAQAKAALPAAVGDLNAAQLVEIRDQDGQVMLHGTLKTSKNEPKETERKAELVSPSGQRAKGKMEVEIERKDGLVSAEEMEFSLEKLGASLQYELFLDGRHVASFMTAKNGRADLKFERKALPSR